MVTRSHIGSLKPRQFTDGTLHWPSLQAFFSDNSAVLECPTCYNIAQKYPEWRVTILVEFHPLFANNTWYLVLSSQAFNIVTCKWVFRTKRLANG